MRVPAERMKRPEWLIAHADYWNPATATITDLRKEWVGSKPMVEIAAVAAALVQPYLVDTLLNVSSQI